MAKKKKKETKKLHRKSEGATFPDWFRDLKNLLEGYSIYDVDLKSCKECYEDDMTAVEVLQTSRYEG